VKTRALLVTAPNVMELGEVEVPEPGAGEVLIESVYTSVSPGTEFRAMVGKQPGMPAFPYIPGYACVGRIIAAGAGTTLKIGTAVFLAGTARVDGANRCWGGHIAHAVRAERDVLPIPDGVSLKEAALLRLAGIAYHGVRLSHPWPHETVVIVGLGPIGQLSARLHAVTGARVIATDISESRCALARAAGVEGVPAGDDFVAAVRAILPEEAGADVVVDASGAVPVHARAVELTRTLPWDDRPITGSRFVVQGSYPADIPVPYNDIFSRELTLLFPRSDQPRDLRAVLDLMQRGRLTVSDLISAEVPVKEAPAAYETLRDPSSGWLTMAVRWQ
jgi:2-desacetyl-2-hydroxyethyl bacteriochlorophyllide A dehydrogenase